MTLRIHHCAPRSFSYRDTAVRQLINANSQSTFVANLAAWGENCGKVAAALRDAYGADDAAVAFFDFFATPAEDFEARAVAVLGEALAAGDSPFLARRATRLLQAYELSFWDALAEGL